MYTIIVYSPRASGSVNRNCKRIACIDRTRSARAAGTIIAGRKHGLGGLDPHPLPANRQILGLSAPERSKCFGVARKLRLKTLYNARETADLISRLKTHFWGGCTSSQLSHIFWRCKQVKRIFFHFVGLRLPCYSKTCIRLIGKFWSGGPGH